MRDSGGHSENDSQGFYPLLRLYTIILVFLCQFCINFWTVPVTSQWNILSHTVHSIYNGSGSLPGFLNTSLVSSIYSLRVKWNTLLASLYLSTTVSFKGGSSPFLWKFPLFVLSPKIKKICFLHRQLRKKRNETDCIRNNKSEYTKFT